MEEKKRKISMKKLKKLGVLVGKVKNDDFPNHAKLLVSNEQKKLLKKQHFVMKEYSRILEKRIKIWIEE